MFLERTVVGLLRISARLLRREEFSNEVLASLRMLLMFKKKSLIRQLSRQVSFGMHDLLRTNASNIHSNEDWTNIFRILQVYGAGSNTPMLISLTGTQPNQLSRTASLNTTTTAKTVKTTEPRYYSNENLTEYSTSEALIDKGYTSDSEIYHQSAEEFQSNESLASQNQVPALNNSLKNLANQYKIDLDDEGLGQHDKKAFVKCCEILTLLTRDLAYINIQNFESCIHCLRSFVEACVIGKISKEMTRPKVNHTGKIRKQKAQQESTTSKRVKDVDSDDDDQFVTSYETISIQVFNELNIFWCFSYAKL